MHMSGGRDQMHTDNALHVIFLQHPIWYFSASVAKQPCKQRVRDPREARAEAKHKHSLNTTK